jgi:CheY-like chemotaxis protein
LLAGRKLLLADDSITIQKVVDLTFADEGVRVVCVNNGREAIEELGKFIPDIVLADVFMPEVSGYEVCEYIKRSERLKHVPVMLLVGSFEPFDEGEARRVGANDTLTKPFQSIRRLIDRVGLLVSGRSPEEQIPTAELPKPEAAAEPEVEKLTTAELEISTADTKPLPPELKHVVDDAVLQQREMAGEAQEALDPAGAQFDQGTMESQKMDLWGEVAQPYEAKPYQAEGEVLLELDDIQTGSALDDDFVLDIDLDEAPEPSPVEPAFSSSSSYGRQRFSPGAGVPSAATITADLPGRSADPMAVTEEFHHDLGAVSEIGDVFRESSSPAATFSEVQVTEAPVAESDASAVATMPGSAISSTIDAPPAAVDAPPAAVDAPLASQVSAEQLSPEMIEAIAKRVVEHMSTSVVQEIAWEVVPQLAELLIKRQLEEKNS